MQSRVRRGPVIPEVLLSEAVQERPRHRSFISLEDYVIGVARPDRAMFSRAERSSYTAPGRDCAQPGGPELGAEPGPKVGGGVFPDRGARGELRTTRPDSSLLLVHALVWPMTQVHAGECGNLLG